MSLESGGAISLVGIGVTFKRDKRSGAYVVKRIVEGGAAARAKSVLPGDVFDEVLPHPLPDRPPPRPGLRIPQERVALAWLVASRCGSAA